MEKTEENTDHIPAVEIKSDISQPAGQVEESSETTGDGDHARCHPPEDETLTKSTDGKTTSRTRSRRNPRTKTVPSVKSKGSNERNGSINETTGEDKVTTRRKRGRPRKDIDDAERYYKRMNVLNINRNR